jgi:parallel beta-helix repeat protein
MLLSFFSTGVVANVVPNKIDLQVSSMNPKIIIVDDDGDGNYTTIQEALNAYLPGDQILVYSGYYPENPNKQNTNNLILHGFNEEYGLNGNSTGFPEVDGTAQGSVFSLENISTLYFNGFHIYNSALFGDAAGIFLKDCSSVTLSNTTIHDCVYGIYMDGLTIGDCKINYNTISNCTLDGIIMKSCSLCWIQNNHIFNCSTNGLVLVNCRDNNIQNNDFISNKRDPIKILSFPFTIQRGSNYVISNNFINNGELCEQEWSFLNKWTGNYWNRSRYFMIYFYHIDIDYICMPPIIDLHPSKNPIP